MTSYAGENTTKIQNDLRRQTKKKQSRGTGVNNKTSHPIDYKEMSRNTPRNFEAVIDVKLFNDIMFWTTNNSTTVTNLVFRRWFMANMRLDENDTKDKDLIVVLHGENARIMNGIGARVKITKNGFVMEDGTAPPVQIWSITFRLNGSEMVGFQAKWDNIRNQMLIL